VEEWAESVTDKQVFNFDGAAGPYLFCGVQICADVGITIAFYKRILQYVIFTAFFIMGIIVGISFLLFSQGEGIIN